MLHGDSQSVAGFPPTTAAASTTGQTSGGVFQPQVVFWGTHPSNDFRAADTPTYALHLAMSSYSGGAWASLLQHCMSKRATVQAETCVRNSLRSEWGFLVEICCSLMLSRAGQCLWLRHSWSEALFHGFLPFLLLCPQFSQPLHSFSAQRPKCLEHQGTVEIRGHSRRLYLC